MSYYIQNYNQFTGDLLTESLTDQSACNEAFAKGKPLTFEDGSFVTPREIINVVEKSLNILAEEFSRTFKFVKKMNIIYLRHSKQVKTMAVDKYMNIYINAGFVVGVLKMEPKYVSAVLMHEILHVLYNHIERGNNWLCAHGYQATDERQFDNNLAADVEVNQTLVKLDLVDEDELINVIHGMYLANVDGIGGAFTNIVPMETILENEEYMKILRSHCPYEPKVEPGGGGKGKTKKTTDEWNQGYKDAWNKVARLIKKYGIKGAWDKLIEAGIVNEVGEIYTDNEISDIMGLGFIVVKSMDDFLNESLEVNAGDRGVTYDDGFMDAFKRLVGKMYASQHPGENGGSPGNQEGDTLKSDLKDEDLDEIEFPGEKNEKSEDSEGDDVPKNIKGGGSENNEENEDQEGQRGGKGKSSGGSGKSQGGDVNKLAKELENGAKSGNSASRESSISKGKGSTVGGTGVFLSDDVADDVLKEGGYSDEDIRKINKVRETNKIKNSPAGIKKAMDELRREIRNGRGGMVSLGRMLDSIDKSSSKYENMWKDIMKKFLAKKSRHAGNQVDQGFDWKNRTRIAMGDVWARKLKADQEPQDINVYVDVSGSMNTELLKVIAKTLFIFSKTYEYSCINICPWAISNNGVFKVDGLANGSADNVASEILAIIEKGANECGGGTSKKAAVSAMVDLIDSALQDKRKTTLKDDVHIVITDGQFDYGNIENYIYSTIDKSFNSGIAKKVPENIFWMIYDADDYLRKEWEKEINKGTLIFINSEVVINNK